MSRHFLFIISAIVLIALAACSKGEDEQAAAPSGQTQEQSAEPPAASIVEPAATDKANGANGADGPDLIQALRENSGVMTPEELAAAVERARNNAEAAAKAVGQNAQQIKAAGDAAATAAQSSLEARQTP
ncbi:antifreeze protein [Falsochrobactrum shanghaiense]|uniref:Antifreeze protein n=2 Tax=Falsochrobactrum shanghaiense TaxID=2201899 RepID=A0A316J923_9HYPH|nr:antifreeze protein [Falsochrobactrum shanghaiense]PWL17265.1 antifreeze protein [Falsochrobactrum shanghaiense]